MSDFQAGGVDAKKLYQKISWISLISAVAPMMGLFGTVAGMMNAFDVIAKIANPKPSALAADINVALATTFFGLAVAIPTLAMYTYLKIRVTNLITEIGMLTGELVERFRPAPEGAE